MSLFYVIKILKAWIPHYQWERKSHAQVSLQTWWSPGSHTWETNQGIRKKVIQDLAHADASLGVIQNVQHHQIGQYINRSTLFHIRDLCGVISHLEEDYKDCSSTDIMIRFLESRKHDYVMLIHYLQMPEIFQ